MDAMFVALKDLKVRMGYLGSIADLKADPKLVSYCLKYEVIAKITPGLLTSSSRAQYTDFLVKATRRYLADRRDIMSWDAFRTQGDVRKVHSILFEFGVAREVFPFDEEVAQCNKEASKPSTSLTVMELYELCQIQFHYKGTFAAFKRMISRRYGSFAEYCIVKGYDINSTRWDSDETAIRVARKLGTLESVRERSKSLSKYLEEHQLIDVAFGKEPD